MPLHSHCRPGNIHFAECHRLYTAFASGKTSPKEEDSEWQAAFELSYSLGCSVLRGRQQLPAPYIDHTTGSSHLLQLALQHQQLVATPKPAAGQGTCLLPVLGCVNLSEAVKNAAGQICVMCLQALL